MFRRKSAVQVVVLNSRVAQMPAGHLEVQNHGELIFLTRREAEAMISRGDARWPKPHELEVPTEPAANE